VQERIPIIRLAALRCDLDELIAQRPAAKDTVKKSGRNIPPRGYPGRFGEEKIQLVGVVKINLG